MDIDKHYELWQYWVYVASKDRLIGVNLFKRINPDPTGQVLEYMLVVYHDGIEVKRISIDKLHTAMFTFKKTIDTEVRHHVQHSGFAPETSISE